MSAVRRVVIAAGDAWVDAVATALLDRLAAAPDLRMCLATGSTPLPVYDRAARSPESFAQASVLLLDEFGGLPADEPASCDCVLRDHLVDRVPLAEYRSIDPDADDLAAELRSIDTWIDGGGIDLAVLGLGRNGHLGMNEPGSPPDGRTARVDLAPTTIEGAQRYFEGRAHPKWGVTVGLRDLLAAREVWVLATGAAKADIVVASVDRPATTDVPASLLRNHPECTWWLDDPADS